MDSKTRDPRKNRKRSYADGTFERHRHMSVRLSKDLQSKYKVKKVPVHRGDTVYVAAGDFIGTEGKVLTANYKTKRLEIDGISREKADKSKILYPIHTSKVVIRRFGKVDRSRKAILERRAKTTVDVEPEDILEPEEEIEEIFEEEDDDLEDLSQEEE
ncbi:MAG: 50S ribosomal protein L24 [Candidatus Heimdallarchaeota archaeon]